jgi:hypothetical protein
MNLGAILRGALKGGAALQVGRAQGQNEGRKQGFEYDLKERERKLKENDFTLRQSEELRRANAEAVRLGLEERRTKAAETTARATAARASRDPAAKSEVQWKTVSAKAAEYRQQGMPPEVASIRARLDVGASVGDGELEAYQRWSRQQKKAAAPPASQVPIPQNAQPAAKRYPSSK